MSDYDYTNREFMQKIVLISKEGKQYCQCPKCKQEFLLGSIEQIKKEGLPPDGLTCPKCGTNVLKDEYSKLFSRMSDVVLVESLFDDVLYTLLQEFIEEKNLGKGFTEWCTSDRLVKVYQELRKRINKLIDEQITDIKELKEEN